jgi:hypothetical protein
MNNSSLWTIMNWGEGRITSNTSFVPSVVTRSYLHHQETEALQEMGLSRMMMSDSQCTRDILIANPVM